VRYSGGAVIRDSQLRLLGIAKLKNFEVCVSNLRKSKIWIDLARI
jgi:hypothetical protein